VDTGGPCGTGADSGRVLSFAMRHQVLRTPARVLAKLRCFSGGIQAPGVPAGPTTACARTGCGKPLRVRSPTLVNACPPPRWLADEGRLVYIQAMPRLREVSRDEADPFVRRIYELLFGERDPVREPGTETGSPGNWWTVFALSPDCFRHAVLGFQLYRSPDRKLDPQLRELGQLRAGWARGSRFVFSQHCKAARTAGLDEARIAAVPHWQTADVFTPVERAVLAYTDCLVLDGGRTPDGVFAALQSHLGDEEILELTYVTTLYEMHATICRALRLEYDDVDERVTEVAAPGGPAMDVMRMVDS
jgi:alkylhydroperoxidase family enzyme